jgi:YVTN family beta-propeller protein
MKKKIALTVSLMVAFLLLAKVDAIAATRAYVTNPFRKFLAVIDTTTHTEITRISLDHGGDGYPASLAITPDGRFVYVLNGDDVAVIDTATNSEIATLPILVELDQSQIVMNRDSTRAYVTNPFRKFLAVIDTTTHTEITRISLEHGGDGYPASLAITPDGRFVYVLNGDDVAVIDTATNSEIATLPILVELDQSQIVMTPAATGSRLLTSLDPAKVWVGLRNSDAVGLRVDLLGEVFVNSQLVGSGQLNNVATGSSGFNNARFNTIPLSLTGGPASLPANAQLTFRLSVRRTCFGAGHNSGTPRLWFNGQPVDSGANADAGSRFSGTIANSTTTYYPRTGFTLNTTAGSSRELVDTPVNSSVACPGRPFNPFGSWSTTVP